MNVLDIGKGLCERLIFGIAIGSDRQHPSAGGNHLALGIARRARVKHDAVLHRVESLNGHPLLVGFRVATAHHHHRHGIARVDVDRGFVKPSIGGSIEQRHEVGAQARHHHLGFGVTHPAIVFYHIGVATHINQTEEHEAHIGQAFGFESGNGGLHNALHHLFHKRLIGKTHGRHRAHTAGVEPLVAFADALVVFCHRQQLIVLAIGEGKHRAFDARKELLNHHRASGSAKAARQHTLEFAFSLLQIIDNEHTLAGSQAVGFEHIGGIEAFQEGKTLVDVFGSDALIGSRGNVVALHKTFGKVFAALELCARLRRSNHLHLRQFGSRMEKVGDTRHQWVFVAHHEHRYSVGSGKFAHGFKIHGRDGHIGAILCGAGIAGSHPKGVEQRALAQFPCYGAFAPAGAEE